MKITFEAEFSHGGIFVTSPNIPGLVASGKTLIEAMREAADAVAALCLAHAIESACGRTPQPIVVA